MENQVIEGRGTEMDADHVGNKPTGHACMCVCVCGGGGCLMADVQSGSGTGLKDTEKLGDGQGG